MAVLILITTAAPSAVSERSGTQAFSFLERHHDTYSAALSGAVSAHASGLEALGSNPAGLAQPGLDREFAFTAAHDFMGIKSGTFGYAYRAGNLGLLAVQAAFTNFGTIDEVDVDADYNPVQTGRALSPTSWFGSLTWARQWNSRIRAGAMLKGIAEHLYTDENMGMALGWGLDGGIQFQPSIRQLGFGLSLTNLGYRERGYTSDVGEDRAMLPATLHAGAFYFLDRASSTRLSAEALVPWHSEPMLALGLEHQLSPWLSFQAGTRVNRYEVTYVAGKLLGTEEGDPVGGNSLKASGGLALKVSRAELNYGVQYWRLLSWVHSFAVSFPVTL